MLTRRMILTTGAAALWSGSARAAYPERVIRLIIPFAPGAGTDIIARLIGTTFERELGTRILFENKAGAGGDIGSELASRAAPDGYTIVVGSTNILLGPILRKEARYNIQTDFVPIGRFATAQLVLVTNPSRTEARSIRELLDYSKRNPKRLNFGSAGGGSPPDLMAEILRLRAGLSYETVPYKGMALALNDLLGGNIEFTNPSLLAVRQHIESGKLRAIAITGSQRMAIAPNIPTFAESGIDMSPMAEGTWWGLFAPAGTPEPIVNTLSQALRRTLADSDTKKKMEESGYGAAYLSPGDFASELKREESVWRSWAPQLRS